MLLQVVGLATTNAVGISIAIMATNLCSFVLLGCASTPSVTIVIGPGMWHATSAKANPKVCRPHHQIGQATSIAAVISIACTVTKHCSFVMPDNVGVPRSTVVTGLKLRHAM